MITADLTDRALRAYWRTGGRSQDIPANSSGPADRDGKRYVVLRSAHGILAVYRVTATGRLTRLRTWPSEL